MSSASRNTAEKKRLCLDGRGALATPMIRREALVAYMSRRVGPIVRWAPHRMPERVLGVRRSAVQDLFGTHQLCPRLVQLLRQRGTALDQRRALTRSAKTICHLGRTTASEKIAATPPV